MERLLEANRLLSKPKVRIGVSDFSEPAMRARPGDFFVIDPPYHPVKHGNNYTSYNAGGFNEEEHLRLRDAVLQINEQGAHFMLFNSWCPEVKHLYKDFKKYRIVRPDAIGRSQRAKNRNAHEYVILNYDRTFERLHLYEY